MVLAVLLALSGFAVAHENDRYHGGALETRQHGYEHGYRDGFHHGREDRERRAGYDFRSDDYKHGDRSYEKYMGDKGRYKNGYREGYQAGYDDAYNSRSGRFGDIYGRRDDYRYVTVTATTTSMKAADGATRMWLMILATAMGWMQAARI